MTRDDAAAHEALLCVQTGTTLADPNRFRLEGGGYYLKSPAEMRALFDTELPGACDTTLEIAERVGDYGPMFAHRNLMPRFPVPEGETEESWLRKQVHRGLEERFPGGVPEAHRRQADYELDVVCQMGFPGYFLVVADLCEHARREGIRVGPGRGSAAGALIAYALRITELDPLRHGLIFERFLNPDRVTMPDIDLDFDERRRGDMIRYATEKYGAERVAQIVTFGTIKAKAAIKDAARVLGYPYALGDRMTKAMPPAVMGKDIPLSGIFDPSHPRYPEAAEFRALCESEPDVREGRRDRPWTGGSDPAGGGARRRCDPLRPAVAGRAADLAARRRRGDHHRLGHGGLRVHRPAQDGLPRACATSPCWTTAWPWSRRTAASSCRSTSWSWTTARPTSCWPAATPWESSSSTVARCGPYCGPWCPTTSRTSPPCCALYRPGPMGANAHNEYADRKNGRKPVVPIHPELAEPLADILDDTYGLIVYQEQVMAIAQKLAGYSLGKADLLRRAMGKKKKEILDQEYVPFSAGMRANGYSDDAIKTLWDILVPFSDYAFNKAHTAGYGLVSYWTAYLKANYPAEYMAALLTSVGDDKDKSAVYLAECRRMGIRVLPPDVNESGARFTAVGDDIRFGLAAVRNVGTATWWRRSCGPAGRRARSATSTTSCARWTRWSATRDDRVADQGGGLRLARAHPARRCWRSTPTPSTPSSTSSATRRSASSTCSAPRWASRPARSPPRRSRTGEWDKAEQLAFEREMLGLYVSDHPLRGLEHVLAGSRRPPDLGPARGGDGGRRRGGEPGRHPVGGAAPDHQAGQVMGLGHAGGPRRRGGGAVLPRTPTRWSGQYVAEDAIVVVRGRVDRRDGPASPDGDGPRGARPDRVGHRAPGGARAPGDPLHTAGGGAATGGVDQSPGSGRGPRQAARRLPGHAAAAGPDAGRPERRPDGRPEGAARPRRRGLTGSERISE